MREVFRAGGIEQHYGKHRILRGCSVYAAPGECVGIAGRNGSGKSTLLSVLAGVSKPEKGTLTYGETDLLKHPGLITKIVGYVPQTNPLIGELRASDNLRLLGGSADPEDPVIVSLGLSKLLKRKTSKLSGGMRRRLAIACALTEHPPVLIMDEPTSAMDLYHKAVIYDYLAAFRSDGGIVIVSTHEVEEMEFCDRLYLLSDGCTEESTPADAARIIKGEG